MALQWTLLHVRASAPEVTYRASFGPPEFPLSIGRPTERRGVCLTGLPPLRGLLVSPLAPRARALGCDLSPLRGWKPAGPLQRSFENRALAHTLKRCSVPPLGGQDALPTAGGPVLSEVEKTPALRKPFHNAIQPSRISHSEPAEIRSHRITPCSKGRCPTFFRVAMEMPLPIR